MTNQEAAVFIVKSFIKNAELKNCANCNEWSRQLNHCSRWRQTPPVEVILYGCPQWDDDIPF